jgi:dipeptide/tripeptide permease
MFYASINVGSVAATLFIPQINQHFGFSVAFLFPAVGLTLVIIIFSSGYARYVHLPPGSSLYTRVFQTIIGAKRGKAYVLNNNVPESTVNHILTSRKSRGQIVDTVVADPLINNQEEEPTNTQIVEEENATNPKFKTLDSVGYLDYAKFYYRPEHVEELYAVFSVLPIFPFIVAFFLCFNQTSSTFLLQATKMNRVVLGYTVLAPQVTALNAITILIVVPLFDRIIYPFFRRRGFLLKHLNRVLFGLVLTCASFCCSALLEYKIQVGAEESISILWQLPQYILITLAELFISVCAIEFVYSQAPKSFKSTLNALYNLCGSMADLIAGFLFIFCKNLPLWQFSLLCAGIVALDFILFIPVAMRFNKKTEGFYLKVCFGIYSFQQLAQTLFFPLILMLLSFH